MLQVRRSDTMSSRLACQTNLTMVDSKTSRVDSWTACSA